MEFEDYEDMFTFEEWSFQHPPSDGNDAKTFDELCEEVLRLSYACDKESSVVHESPSNVSEVSSSSKSHEDTQVEHVHAVESVITSDTSLTSHLKPDRDCHFQHDFVGDGAQTTNDYISLAEKHDNSPQYSSEEGNISTEMVSAGREAQCLEDKLVSKNSEEFPTQVAMNVATLNAGETFLDPNLHSTHNASSQDEKQLHSSTDTLQHTPEQTPCKNAIVSCEETEVLISTDTNGENTQTENCMCNKDISVASEIQSDEKNVLSDITTSLIQNTHIENESSKDAVNDSSISDNEYGMKAQNKMLEFQIKVDVNSEIKCVSESKDNQYDITVGLADSKNTQLNCTSVKGNLTSNLVSVMAKSLSPINSSSQIPEFANVDCVTGAARNELDHSEASEKHFPSPETFHKSPPFEAASPSSFPSNQKNKEERTDTFLTKSNADTSPSVITCGSEPEYVLSPKDSNSNFQELGNEMYPNNDSIVETRTDFKKEKNQTFHSISIINDVEVNAVINDVGVNAEILFCTRNSLENKRKENVQSVELSKIQQESENTVIKDARTVKSKLVLQRTRNETSGLHNEHISNNSKKSPQNHLQVKKRRFKSRPPVSQERIKTYSNKKRSEKLLQSTIEAKAANISNDKPTESTTNGSEKESITLSKSAAMGSQEAMDEDNLKSITLDIQESENKFESLIEVITLPQTWKMVDDSEIFIPEFLVSTTKESVDNEGKEEFVLPLSNSREPETFIANDQPERQMNNISKEVIYLRTTDTITTIDNTTASRNPPTDEINCCEQTSTATIEINTNKQVSKGTLRTVINVKHNCISPEGESSGIINQSNASGEERIMTSRTRGAARILPFSRYAGSPLALGPSRSTLNETSTIGTAHRTDVRSLEKESDLHSHHRNVAKDNNDELIVIEPNEQSGRVFQPKTYERTIIRYDYITPKIDNRDPRSRKRVADSLTPEVNETSSQVSLDNKSESTAPNEESMMSLPKKPRLVSAEKSLTVNGNSANESSIQSKVDIEKIDPLDINSQNEIQNSKNLENTSKKQLEKPSMPSILVTQEDENLEGGTTRIIHRLENQSNLNSTEINQVDNSQEDTPSNVNESLCQNPFSDASSNIFNAETIKAICASEKAEMSLPSPAQSIESGKSFAVEPTKNLRHPSRNSRAGMMRRSCDSRCEPSLSTRKSRVDILKSQAKFLRSAPHRSPSHNAKTEGEKKTSIETALTSRHPRSESQVKQKPCTEGSKPSEGAPSASEPPQTATESEIRACPVRFGTASATRTVRRLRRNSAPLPLPDPSSSSTQGAAASTSGRVLRRRVHPPTQPPAPTPPTA